MSETFLKMHFFPGAFQDFCSNLIHLYRLLKDLRAATSSNSSRSFFLLDNFQF